jgi:hypothetical protein
MYHEVTQPYGLLYNLIPALKPNARVGIVDTFAPPSVASRTRPEAIVACRAS